MAYLKQKIYNYTIYYGGRTFYIKALTCTPVKNYYFVFVSARLQQQCFNLFSVRYIKTTKCAMYNHAYIYMIYLSLQMAIHL